MTVSSTPSTASSSSRLSYSDITPEQQRTIDAIYGGDKIVIAAKGHGKAVCGQTAAQELLAAGELTRVLVLAPLKVCQLTWGREHEVWNHLDKPGMALGSANFRENIMRNEHYSIVVLNIENWPWAVKTGLYALFDGVLIDEVSKFKAAGSAGVRSMRKVRKHFKWVCGMTASPVAETGIDLYAQMLVVAGKDSPLGTNFDRFKQQYGIPLDFNEHKWGIRPGLEEALANAVKDYIYVADDAGYLASLPELRDEVIEVEMPDDGWEAYRQMAEGAYIDRFDIEAANPAVVSSKLLQVTSGAVINTEDTTVHWVHWAKYEALQAFLTGVEGSVLIQYQFVYQKQELQATFPGIKFLGDDPERLEQEWNAGQLPLLGVHARSASHGLNLQAGGHELVILTPIWSADMNEQLLGRIRRRGQRSKYVRRTTLVVPGTVDQIIMDRMLGKEIDESRLQAHLKEVTQ